MFLFIMIYISIDPVLTLGSYMGEMIQKAVESFYVDINLVEQ